MKRPAYGLLVGVAILMGLVAVVASWSLDERLRDPDGFLGPAWVRLQAMVVGAFLADVVPRALWRAGRQPRHGGAPRPPDRAGALDPATRSAWW